MRSTLIPLVGESAGELANVNSDCVPLVDLLGIIFQIRDDYQNLQNEQYAKNKGFAEDITEGKFSYPIVHSIRSSAASGSSGSSGSSELMNILRQKTDDEAVKRYTICILEKTGSFEYTRRKLTELMSAARAVLAGFGSAEAAGLEGILDFLELKE